VLLAHPGTQYAPRLASELERRGLLKRYWTSIAFARDGSVDRSSRFLPGPLRRAVASRIVDGVPQCRLRTMPSIEFAALAKIRCGANVEDAIHARNARFQRDIPSSELDAASVVVGFDTSSWILAERRAKRGLPFVLDQSIGHPVAKERAYSALRQRYPDWDAGAVKKCAELVDVECEEHKLASVIVVPSEFVKRTLEDQGVPSDKIKINPFGVDLDLFQPAPDARPTNKVVFLFAGAISVRKGFPLLLESWRNAGLDNAELWIVGGGAIPSSAMPLPAGILLHGKLGRKKLAELMRQADVFVFPSFYEGLAQVQIEALASGVPVFGTFESGASQIVTDGVEGRVIASGDVDAWTCAFRDSAKNPDAIATMRRSVMSKRATLSWSEYGNRYAAILKDVN
jgi:alpha-maltose-1-phosphate synthase